MKTKNSIPKKKRRVPLLYMRLNNQRQKLFNEVREMLGVRTLTKATEAALTSFLSNKKIIADLEKQIQNLNTVIEEKDELIQQIHYEVITLKDLEEEHARIAKSIVQQKLKIEKITGRRGKEVKRGLKKAFGL